MVDAAGPNKPSFQLTWGEVSNVSIVQLPVDKFTFWVVRHKRYLTRLERSAAWFCYKDDRGLPGFQSTSLRTLFLYIHNKGKRKYLKNPKEPPSAVSHLQCSRCKKLDG